MSIKIILVPLCSILFLCLSCDKGDDPITADIFPGEGLTEIKFSDTGSDAQSKFGMPGTEAIVGETHQWNFGSLGIGLIFYNVSSSTDNKTVDEILVNPGYEGKTKEGIGIGSPKSDVIAAYGEPTSENFPFGFVYEDLKITVDYNEDKVNQIRLRK